jgi:hypothetical protein
MHRANCISANRANFSCAVRSNKKALQNVLQGFFNGIDD